MATAINSPWALWIHQGDLYIAMAGPHQIWRMPLTEKEIGPYAGNGREDIVDGPLLPRPIRRIPLARWSHSISAWHIEKRRWTAAPSLRSARMLPGRAPT